MILPKININCHISFNAQYFDPWCCNVNTWIKHILEAVVRQENLHTVGKAVCTFDREIYSITTKHFVPKHSFQRCLVIV